MAKKKKTGKKTKKLRKKLEKKKNKNKKKKSEKKKTPLLKPVKKPAKIKKPKHIPVPIPIPKPLFKTAKVKAPKKTISREEKIRQARESIRIGTMKPGKIAALKEELGAIEIGICREFICDLTASTRDYCRLHYIKNWKIIKRKEDILKDGRLNEYIDELISKYPDKYIGLIKQDMSSDKDFTKVIADLEIDEPTEEGSEDQADDNEQDEAVIKNIKRDFEPEGGFEEGDF